MHILMLPHRTEGKYHRDNGAYNKMCSPEGEKYLRQHNVGVCAVI